MRVPQLHATLVIAALLTAPVGPVEAQSQPDPVGTWEGALDTGAGSLRIVFHVTRGSDGALSATMDSPDQGATGIPATTVTLEGSTLRIDIAAVAGGFEGTLSEDGDALGGTWSQGPARLPLSLERVEGASEGPARPQEPSEPLPYRSLDVTLPGGAPGVELAGTLTLPDGEGPFPGVVLVSGSGPQDRNEALMGHRPFLVLSDHLTRAGIAVLRYDDRGVGGSTGSFAEATTEDFAADALAAVAHLRVHPSVAADRVGVLGHSEGGLVGPMASVRSPDVAFVVMLAGPGLPGKDIIQLQSRLIARASGIPEATIEENLAVQARLAEIVRQEPDPTAAAPLLRAALKEATAGATAEERRQLEASGGIEAQIQQANSPWFRFFLHYDPRPVLEKVSVPVLALLGGKDLQVPAEANAREIEGAFSRSGNPDATVRTLPAMNHLFQTAGTGAPSEYGQITETMSPAALQAMSSWILERFGG